MPPRAKRRPRVRYRDRTVLAKVLREQGRRLTWLAEKTGYSESTVGAVARGEREGTEAFYKLASYVLGEEVAP